MTKPDRTRVLVLYGGRSAEHEISILSTRFIVDSLDRERFEPLLVAIDHDGGWHLQREGDLPTSNDPRTVHINPAGAGAFIRPMPAKAERAGVIHIDGAEPRAFDVAFPVLHGPMGEDGCMQGLLELAGVPFVGSGVTGSAVGMDKLIQKQILETAEVPVVPYVGLLRHSWDHGRDAAIEHCEALGYPLFVKPANLGSSLGIGRAGQRSELCDAIAQAFEFDTKLVIEEGLVGAREIECSVLGNDDPQVSLPGEIVVDHGDGFYSYEAKYVDGEAAKLCVPADLPAAEVSAIQLLALRAYRALDSAGMARVDLFVTTDRGAYLNEINTIPGFTAISMYPQLWNQSGLQPKELVSRLIELALDRHRQRAGLRTRA
jgi:D-alanine-D-alanine ligase